MPNSKNLNIQNVPGEVISKTCQFSQKMKLKSIPVQYIPSFTEL